MNEEDIEDIMRKKSLSAKTIVVTGASSGAGKAIALEMARRGAKLVLAARRQKALEEVAAECIALGAEALVQTTDVTDAEAVKALAVLAKQWGGSLDVWVNNAGVLAAGPFDETPIAVHSQVIQTNLVGYIHGAHAAMPHFKEQGYGILINNISVGGWMPTPYAAGYTASKFGLRGFSEALRGELHRWPEIYVCDIFPAFLDTPGIQHAGNYTGHVLRPAPPVYDPQKVAIAVANLALNPRKGTIIGAMAGFLKIAHAISPLLTRKVTAGFIETYFKNADSIPYTDGNLFQPTEYGTSIHGGWRTPPTDRQKLVSSALLVLGVTIGLLLAGRKN